MNTSDYIISQLQHCSEYALTDSDRELVDKQGIETFIYTKLTSKKFRKWAVDENSEQQAKHAIHLNVAAEKPLQFRYPFGGYKLWRLPSAPEVDWAEFFAIAYYCKYLAPIAAAYKPGIEFLFASDDVIIERMDNIPIADTDAYFSSFKQLLAAFRQYFPANFKMDIVRIGDLYEDKIAMEQELSDNIARVAQDYATSVDETRKQKMYKTSELNVCWNGAKDLTDLSETEKRLVVEMGPVYHDAYGALSKRQAFNRGEDKIVIFTTVIPKAIAVGTTKTSITKYWTGFGVLEPTDNKFKARVLSPSQLTEAKLTTKPVNIPNLTGKNFGHISIIDKPLA